MTNQDDEVSSGNYENRYLNKNEKAFRKVLAKYVEIGTQAMFCAANSMYRTRNQTRTSKGSEFMADVENVSKRILSPALWDKWCEICLQEAGREHSEILASDYTAIAERTGQAYIKARLEPWNYFRHIKRRQSDEVRRLA